MFILFVLFFVLTFSSSASPSLEEVLAICQDNQMPSLENIQIPCEEDINKSSIELNSLPSSASQKNDGRKVSENKTVFKLPILNTVIEEEKITKEGQKTVDFSYFDIPEMPLSDNSVFADDDESRKTEKDFLLSSDIKINQTEKRRKWLRDYKASCRNIRLTNSKIERVDHRYFSKESNIF